ncbi:MAG: hypothetical protein ACU0DT_19465 [Albimonas sp.]|uniref:hypothetical protein n=1 Tax=Albimonas sp. TaxID=1872425 RepID=UPI0040569CA3
MKLFTFALGLAAAVAALPQASEATLPWLLATVGDGYGAGSARTLGLVWQGILAVLIFAGVRFGVSLVVSALSLAAALRLLPRSRRR